MADTSSRLLMEIERAIREINRTTISAVIPEITLGGIKPVMTLVARARAEYLRELFNLAGIVEATLPSQEQIIKLRQLRETYEEMVSGAQSLETAIQRGYIDVESRQ